MFAPFALAVSLAAAAQAIPVKPGISVELQVRAAFPGGDSKVIKSFVLRDVRQPQTVYIQVPKTLCEAIVVSSDEPASTVNRWSVQIVPSTSGGAEVRSRGKWSLGADMSRSSSATTNLRFGNSSYLSRAVLDTVDGGSRVEIALKLRSLKNLDPGSAEADRLAEVSSDPAVVVLRTQNQERERELARAQERGLGQMHPEIRRLQSEMTLASEQMRARKLQIVAGLINQYEKATVPLAPVDGCNALSATLEAGLVRADSAELLEAELWFVHKAPDGKETAQRQTVRMRSSGSGDFYFDDMNLVLGTNQMRIPIAVEVFGGLQIGTMEPNGDIRVTLNLTRRYINRETAFGTSPKTGKTEYPTVVKAGEVISFILPPLADDGGILLGHRFSVRLRIKAVGGDDLAGRQ